VDAWSAEGSVQGDRGSGGQKVEVIIVTERSTGGACARVPRASIVRAYMRRMVCGKCVVQVVCEIGMRCGPVRDQLQQIQNQLATHRSIPACNPRAPRLPRLGRQLHIMKHALHALCELEAAFYLEAC
jgi:hypothetical protein